MKEIRIGLFGFTEASHRTRTILSTGASIVAVCDAREEKLEKAKAELGRGLATYRDFDEMLAHPGLDAVYLCNYFHCHVPYAIRALERGIHVLSECASNATMAEGVALVRAAEKSNAIYMLAENFQYMCFNLELRRLAESGTLGRIVYAEGEYNHPSNISGEAVLSVRPHEKHWRNFLPRSYYITHSIGPLMYMTGANPTRVTALPVFSPEEPDMLMGYSVGDRAAIITCLNDDDSVFRVTGCAAFGGHEHSYRLCGTRGQAENLRDNSGRVLLRYNDWQVPKGKSTAEIYLPEWNDRDEALIKMAGHGGGDYLMFREFFNCIREGRRPFFDVYRATVMSSVAILSHRSLLERGVPYDIPDFHRTEDLERYENDTLSPFWGEDGSAPTLPCCSRPDFVPDPAVVEAYHAVLRKQGADGVKK